MPAACPPPACLACCRPAVPAGVCPRATCCLPPGLLACRLPACVLPFWGGCRLPGLPVPLPAPGLRLPVGVCPRAACCLPPGLLAFACGRCLLARRPARRLPRCRARAPAACLPAAASACLPRPLPPASQPAACRRARAQALTQGVPVALTDTSGHGRAAFNMNLAYAVGLRATSPDLRSGAHSRVHQTSRRPRPAGHHACVRRVPCAPRQGDVRRPHTALGRRDRGAFREDGPTSQGARAGYRPEFRAHHALQRPAPPHLRRPGVAITPALSPGGHRVATLSTPRGAGNGESIHSALAGPAG